jgi:5-methyltetrahydropteroyltriglutamate--homocysteine methyltransferase
VTEPGVPRADVVGSLLRPGYLVDARAALRAGQLDDDGFGRVADRAVDEALRLQEAAGVDVVTDGEMRRTIFFDFLVSGLDGLSPLPSSTIRFHGHRPDDAMEVTIPFTVTERLRARSCPGVAELRYAAARTSLPVKVTLPSPMMMLGFWNERSRDAYPDPFELAADAAHAVRGWMRELADAGCRYIQIDAPELAEAYADERVRAEYDERGISSERFLAVGTELVCGLGDVDLPGVTVAMHLCKGNGTQSWIAEGGYESLAAEVFRRARGFDRFLLEYDDERSGSFEPLQQLPDDKVAVLGLVSTKWTRLEEVDALRARVEQAARFHPRDRLAVSTQCGFASASETAEQRRITGGTEAAKLKLVADVARAVWGPKELY